MVSMSAKSAPPAFSAFACSAKDAERSGRCQQAERLHQFAGRSHRAGHQPIARHFTREPRTGLVQLENAICELVELEPVALAAERIGRDEVAAGLDVARDKSTTHDVGLL